MTSKRHEPTYVVYHLEDIEGPDHVPEYVRARNQTGFSRAEAEGYANALSPIREPVVIPEALERALLDRGASLGVARAIAGLLDRNGDLAPFAYLGTPSVRQNGAKAAAHIKAAFDALFPKR